MRLVDLYSARMPGARSGAWKGLTIGAVLAVLTLAGSDHGTLSGPGIPRTSVTRLVLWYVVGGIAAGGIAGFLRPLANRPIGAAFVGVLAAVPIAVYADLFIVDGSPGDPLNILSVATASALVGAFLGVTLRWSARRRARRNAARDA